ncbi:hypothetical protein L226DRAFT_516611 [Lentinus tigrinus ALCF2SS1-7]|uniref:Uncharacterized protein n=1 Tax=Lentinus tigrinus ALCF2SS1-6 TaxID=1328759 RepID=A0A5C2RVD5_9APHY|nr:hypothetical protein L227DRAFT_535122 [Lentinus tigrinus ALCF2SS1-6]RPD68901.1 hypothetical protein L226DRAFT_516611 [Lentinus tigrinus ALCF2SS1-7]
MELPEPLPLSRSASRSDHPPRRRRTSLSGKLLNFIAPKPKPLPEPPLRPLISYPQPLHPRVPARSKRDFRELAAPTDENDPPRPHSRPRLLSNQSVGSNHTARDLAPVPVLKKSNLHVPPRHDARPLKSALKKSSSENDAPPSSFSPTTDTTTRPGRGVSTQTTSASKAKDPTLVKRIRTKSWVPKFSTRNHPPEAVPDTRRASSPMVNTKPRKTVTFGRELKRTPSMLDVSNADSDPAADESFVLDDHWEEISMELDADGSLPGKRKFECEGDPRYGSPRPSSPILTRSHAVFTPVVPSQAPLSDRLPPNNESRDTSKAASKGTHLDVALRPFLAPVPLPTVSAFEVPPGRTIAGEIMDEVLKDYAQEKNRVFKPIPVTKRGPSGVLQRINIDIVPNERHTTVWDVNDADTYAWGGTLVIRDSKAPSYFYPRHCIQEFKIEFAVLSSPTSPSSPPSSPSDPDAPQTYEWRTSHTGHFLPRTDVLTRLSSERGISVEPEYRFVPSADSPDGPCAWLVHFWVPVPLRLLSREVCRTFVCRARVTVGDWETPRTDVPAGCVSVTIESLKSANLLGHGQESSERVSQSGAGMGARRSKIRSTSEAATVSQPQKKA